MCAGCVWVGAGGAPTVFETLALTRCFLFSLSLSLLARSALPRRYEAFKEHGGSEAEVKAAGKYRTQGRLYEMVDGDIVFFKHGA